MKRKSSGCKCNGNSTVCKCSKLLTPESSDPQKQSQLVWPNWLPSDWLIHRVLHDPEQPIYITGPEGEKFFLPKKNTDLYHAKQPRKKRTMEATKMVISESDDKAEGKKVAEEGPEQPFIDIPPPEWPDWLPHGWCIERSCENPAEVCYRSPRWIDKCGSKDEVLHHLNRKSKD